MLQHISFKISLKNIHFEFQAMAVILLSPAGLQGGSGPAAIVGCLDLAAKRVRITSSSVSISLTDDASLKTIEYLDELEVSEKSGKIRENPGNSGHFRETIGKVGESLAIKYYVLELFVGPQIRS